MSTPTNNPLTNPNDSSTVARNETSRLRAKFGELRSLQAVGRIQLWSLAFAVIAMFGGFAYTTYTQTKQNFSRDNIASAAAASLPEITPAVQAELTKVASKVIPTYKDLASERFAAVAPQVSAAAVIRLERLPKDAGVVMSNHLLGSFDRVLKRIEPQVNAAFPTLTDSTRREILAAHFFNVVEAKNAEIAAHVDSTYTSELIRLHAILEKFYVPDTTRGPLSAAQTEQLQKRFIGSLLGLAQHELESHPSGSPVTADVSR